MAANITTKPQTAGRKYRGIIRMPPKTQTLPAKRWVAYQFSSSARAQGVLTPMEVLRRNLGMKLPMTMNRMPMGAKIILDMSIFSPRLPIYMAAMTVLVSTGMIHRTIFMALSFWSLSLLVMWEMKTQNQCMANISRGMKKMAKPRPALPSASPAAFQWMFMEAGS